MITLRPFTREDLPALDGWCKTIDAWRYLSRCVPRRFNRRSLPADEAYQWSVIVVDGTAVGTVWLEKEEAGIVRLGILIGREDLLGQGIGRAAIDLAIRTAPADFSLARVRLHVRKNNARAIACYRACGFRQTGEGCKLDPQGESIEFLEMEKARA
ncbi:MAG: GNAT family N-acetyltransferase [Myxococcales bacterium]|nr:GNAT family N-acetyltransferase [Myxococcales bacterium]